MTPRELAGRPISSIELPHFRRVILQPPLHQIHGERDGKIYDETEQRRIAQERGLIKRKADLDVPREPSVAGIDGSYQLHRLTSLDVCAAAAVAIEGTSKEATRYWPEPYHRMWAGGVPHNDNTTGVLRGLMVGMELELAREAPHDLVLLDGKIESIKGGSTQVITPRL